MLRRVVWSLIVIAALASLAGFAPSCGGLAVGLTMGANPYYDWAWDPLYRIRVYDGLWRGNYVWYDDQWCLYGYGTPYYWDHYNPYWW